MHCSFTIVAEQEQQPVFTSTSGSAVIQGIVDDVFNEH